MTSVFLSYDRDDGAKARSIASAIEKFGHSVWWDRHIASGAQYSREIEAALKAAEAVVVLWSRQSVDSAWVRDEAAAGRDSGRLVPIKLDVTEPPMGFRQYQTTDLSKWRGRASSPAFQEVLRAIDTLGASAAVEASLTPRKIAALPLRFSVLVTIAAAVAIIACLSIWRPWGGGTSVPVVAVAAASDSVPARGLARDLLAKLGNLHATKTDALKLVQGNGTGKADFTFEVDAVTTAELATANLILLGGDDRSLLWSRDFEQPAAKQADLKQQLAYSAAKVLECAMQAVTSERTRLRQETLKLHLKGCAGLSLLQTNDPETLLPVLRRVTEEAPRLEGAWANLLQAEMDFLQQNYDDRQIRRRLRSDIAQARRVNPNLVEAFVAEAWLSPPRPINGWLRFVERAVESNPNHSGALQERSLGYHHVGRMKDALHDAQRAVQFDPLSPSARSGLASTYAYAGQLEAAEAELDEAERLWPGAGSVVSARYRIDLRYGDARAALALLDSGEIASQNIAEARAFLNARIDRSPVNLNRALAEARAWFASDPESLSNPIQSMAEFGRVDELVQILMAADPKLIPGLTSVLFRPQFSALHHDRRFMAIAGRLGLIDYWRTTGKWPDFCREPELPYNCKAEAAKFDSRNGRQ